MELTLVPTYTTSCDRILESSLQEGRSTLTSDISSTLQTVQRHTTHTKSRIHIQNQESISNHIELRLSFACGVPTL